MLLKLQLTFRGTPFATQNEALDKAIAMRDKELAAQSQALDKAIASQSADLKEALMRQNEEWSSRFGIPKKRS